MLTTLDNLAAHFAEEVECVCREGHVLLCCFPKNTTDSTQMTDAGCGRSVRCSVGRALDE